MLKRDILLMEKCISVDYTLEIMFIIAFKTVLKLFNEKLMHQVACLKTSTYQITWELVPEKCDHLISVLSNMVSQKKVRLILLE